MGQLTSMEFKNLHQDLNHHKVKALHYQPQEKVKQLSLEIQVQYLKLKMKKMGM